MNSEYLSSLEEFEQDASDNDECSTNKVILKVNDSFNDWISVQTVVDLYAKHTEDSREPLAELPEISNSEYHKTKGRPPKRLKSSIEESKNKFVGNIQRTCRYCLVKGHNIRSCANYKAEMVGNKENI
ncbi:hypothetical protein C1646_673116 [Rhizophagus diaphanus]|nr:hypothetical protein C1646_673116 [Rhizophagus diaphanus] [Rhizophagus sp. MUCL 43196]